MYEPKIFGLIGHDQPRLHLPQTSSLGARHHGLSTQPCIGLKSDYIPRKGKDELYEEGNIVVDPRNPAGLDARPGQR